MEQNENRRIQFTDDLRIHRLLNGMWQISGAHGPIDRRKAIEVMLAYHDAGFTTWDLADHYGPAEDFIGEFRRQLQTVRGVAGLADVQAFTKWVPQPMRMTLPIVKEAIEKSLRRMNFESLDLLQFHWWDYGNDQYLAALDIMAQLQQAGKIKHLALTNFDTEHLQRIIEHGIKIVSNQVQYSLIDRRPEIRMVPLCQERQVWLLTYGTLCGGFLSDKYLGEPEPGRWSLETASRPSTCSQAIPDPDFGLALAQQDLDDIRTTVEADHILDCRQAAEQPMPPVRVSTRLKVSSAIMTAL